MRRSIFWSVLILLLAVALRLRLSSYGLDDICLTVPEETWLYDSYQPVSLYNWNIAPRWSLMVIPGRAQSAPLATPESPPVLRFLLRLGGIAAGLVVVALTLHVARRLRANWWWLAGLLVSVAPWFVTTDRWVVRFELADLAIALSVTALLATQQLADGWRREVLITIELVSALSLFVITPPLWWLAIGLTLLQPFRRWRRVWFIVLAGVVAIPGLQTPEHWLAAAQSWDAGVTAASVWGILALALWWWRELPSVQQAVLLGGILIAGGVTIYQDSPFVTPDADEWELIHWLQQRTPDGATVRFDSATWPFARIMACPVGANIAFTPQSSPVPFFDYRDLGEPYYSVTTQLDEVAALPYVTRIADRFLIGRSLKVTNPVDISFGDLVYILSYEIKTPVVKPQQLVDIRVDYQFGPHVTPDALAYVAFLHITAVGDPEMKWVDTSEPFIEESGHTGSRNVLLNHHFRVWLPLEIPPGSYDVVFGSFNVYTGERLHWSGGDHLILGQIQVE
jgi:hypothetical protein